MMEVWNACVVDITKSTLEYQALTCLRYQRIYPGSDLRNMEDMKHFAEAVGRSTPGRLDKETKRATVKLIQNKVRKFILQ